MFLGTVALALALQPSPTPSPSSVEVAWRGPPGCVDVARFQGLVLELSGMPGAAVGLTASSDAGKIWHVEVEFDGVTRVLAGGDCRILTEAAALVVAVRVDPVRTVTVMRPRLTEAEPTAAEPVARDPVARDPVAPTRGRAQPRLPPAEPVRASRPRVPWSPTVVAGVAASFGTLPREGASLRLDAGVRRDVLELDVGAIATLGPRSDDAADGSFRLFGGQGQACAVLFAAPVEVPLCGRLELGVLQARPQGLSRPKNINALWVAPAVRAAVARRKGRFAPEGFLELALPLQRHRFEADGVGQVHRLPSVVVRLGLALRWKGRG